MERHIRTDLAVEQRELVRGSVAETTELPGVRAVEENRHGFKVTTVDILDEQGSSSLCKPIGKYVTIDLEALLHRTENSFSESATLLSEIIREMLGGDISGSTLVAGLGNASMTPDAIGPLAVDSIVATRHLKQQMPKDFERFSDVSAIRPGVLGSTGIESAQLLSSVCGAVSPSRVIAVDALASSSLERLCKTVQVSNVGIVPGSGVGNDRAELCERTLGVPVIAVGVPTVVDASSFTDDVGAKGMFVTPRDIDASVKDMAKLIGYGINLALHDGMTLGDVDMLVS